MDGFDRRIASLPGLTVTRDMPLSEVTTWKVGGPADYFVVVETRDSLERLLHLCRTEDLPFRMIGKGSNLLISDDGCRGVVCRLGSGFKRIEATRTGLSAGGAVALHKLAVTAGEEGLSGLEFAAGMPGSVGGAIMTNAGAFGGSMGSVTDRLGVMAEDGSYREVTVLESGYRKPLVNEDLVIVEAGISLRPESRDTVKDRMDRNIVARRKNQPVGESTAGSVFKNPPGKSAGELIEMCGLKGTAVGGAMISDLHANFIINTGEASARDIRELIEMVRRRIKDQTGVSLELEVEMQGFEVGR